MPEFIHNFTQGKMNHDLDERMVPNGQYRDALNVTVATSESSNVGALQNLKGNIELKGSPASSGNWSSDYINSLNDPVCIGSVRHEPTECIYWFIATAKGTTRSRISVIAEFNQKTGDVTPVFVDTKGILNFTKNNLITGVNIIDDLLFFTDNINEPKKVNIKKFKEGSSNGGTPSFLVHSKIPTYNVNNRTYTYNASGADAAEEDITVIKKSPLNEPGLVMSASLANGPGTGVNPITTTYSANNYYNFTYVTVASTGNQPAEYEPLPTYQEYQEALGTGGAFPTNMEFVNIVVSAVPTGYNSGDTITLSGSHINDYNNEDEYTIRLEIDQVNGAILKCKIQSIPSRILRFGANQDELITWEVLLEEKDPMFEFDFPRFAYRWKYENGEYSTFSPFSGPAFIGNQFEYLSSDGYNLGMRNNLRSLDINNLYWGTTEVIELDILYKASNSNTVYVVDTLKDRTKTSFTIKNELIGAAVEANQLLRPWDNVPRKAKAQEVSANRLIYANYIQNYDVPKTNLLLTLGHSAHTGLSSDSETFRDPIQSVKSIRKYQLGIVFQDAYGRQTPVFSDANATINVDKENAVGINKFIATVPPMQNIPNWITHYKYFVKDISNEYYNLALDRFYFAEDGNVWLSFPSSERSKVQIDTYLILKKQHDVDNPSVGPCRYKVLDVQSDAPEFVANSKKIIASARCEVSTGFQEDFSLITFTGPNADDNSQFATAFNGDSFITISDGGNTTDIIGVKFGGPVSSNGTSYEVQLDEPFGADASFFGVSGLVEGATITINVYKNEEERLPEFEGRFFVKINRDTDFDVNIIKTFSGLNKRYGIIASAYVDKPICSPSLRGEPSRWGTFFWDAGESQKNGTTRCACPSSYRHKGTNGGGNGNRLDGWNGIPTNSLPFEDGGYGSMQRAYFSGAATGSNRIGILRAGFGAEGLYPNDDVLGGQRSFWKEKAVKGALVRIVHNDGRVTKPYEITNHWRWRGTRGINKCGCTGFPSFKSCNDCQKGIGSNRVFSLALELEQDIQEDWVGNGVRTGGLTNIRGFQIVEEVISDDNKIISSTNPAIFETEPKEAVDIDIYYEASNALPIANISQQSTVLSYYNCYSFGNGVESDRIRDDFNATRIGKGVKVSASLDEPYMEERRSSGLIFSQIYNSQAGINRLNQFIQAQPITKDLNPEYGSIQKLHSRNTNLITLCEDKCLKILANKDALFNADGSANITSNKAVLGQAVPYAGEFGISTNPESFASYGFRAYFSDKNRGAVIRLSQDGITNIALKGMSDFFADNLPSSTKIIGSYNDDKENYNLTLDYLTDEWQDKLSKTPKDKTHCEVPNDESDDIETTTVSFKETVDGWTSRKSYYTKTGSIFYPLESGESLNDKYYTFNKGLIWEHASNPIYNNFYGTQYDSSVNVVINDATESIKGFKTLNYSGTDSRKYSYNTSSGLTGLSIDQVVAQQISPSIINAENYTPGWYTNYINTDMEEGMIKEFAKKENKYFNKIKGIKTYYNDNCDNNIDSSAFQTQGLGFATVTSSAPTAFKLTVKVDASCSTGTGNDPLPDTTKKFWYYWTCTKTGSNVNVDIRQTATDQLVKCGIEEFYNNFPNNYTGIDKNYFNFKFFNSSGVNVNTILYNENNESISTSGKFLYVEPASTPDNNALNANVSGTAVPNTYFILTVTNGVITAKTQYNTLASCGTPLVAVDFSLFVGYRVGGNSTNLLTGTAAQHGTPSGRAALAKTQLKDWLTGPLIGQVSSNRLIRQSDIYKYSGATGLVVGAQLHNDIGPIATDGIFGHNTNSAPIPNGYWSYTSPSSNLLKTDAGWSSLDSAWKFITFENGIVTHITTMNTL